MAKAGFDAGEFASGLYQRRDPVSGQKKSWVRYPHARQSARRLRWHQRCVREGMQGFTPSGATPSERSKSIRARLAEVARQCAARNPEPAAARTRRAAAAPSPTGMVIARS